MKKRKEPNYLLIYVLSLIITIGLHYLIFSGISIHPTINLIIGFFIFTIVMALIMGIAERLNKKS